MSCSTNLRCVKCGRAYPIEKGRYICDECGERIVKTVSVIDGLLEVEYNYDGITLTKKDIESRPLRSIWKYRELLPIRDMSKIVSLGEGGTPLHKCNRLSKKLGIRDLYIKNEGMNPIGSFKDRETSVIISKALEFGEKITTIASSGNAGASVAAYSNCSDLDSVIFVPITFAPRGKLSQYAAFGPKMIGVRGHYEDANLLSLEVGRKFGWYLCNHGYNPYRIEGDKTTAYEICEQLDWEVPNKVVVPVGSGGNLSGEWKGFKELLQLGFINKLPGMIAGQVEAGAPLIKALEEKKEVVEPYPEAGMSIADGVIAKYLDYAPMALQAIRKSKGTGAAVSDIEVISAEKLLARTEGIFVEPSAAVSIAALEKLITLGEIDKDETVVCVVTATGLKNPEVMLKDFEPPLEVEVGPDALELICKYLKTI